MDEELSKIKFLTIDAIENAIRSGKKVTIMFSRHSGKTELLAQVAEIRK